MHEEVAGGGKQTRDELVEVSASKVLLESPREGQEVKQLASGSQLQHHQTHVLHLAALARVLHLPLHVLEPDDVLVLHARQRLDLALHLRVVRVLRGV